MIGLRRKTSPKQVLVEFLQAEYYGQGFFFNHGIFSLTWRQVCDAKAMGRSSCSSVTCDNAAPRPNDDASTAKLTGFTEL